MAKTIKVTPEKLKNVAAEIRECASAYEKEYTSLIDTVDAMSNEWKGEASTQFKNKIHGFKNELVKMKNLMDRYAEHLEDGATAYTEAEEANQQKFSSLIGSVE